MAFTETTMTYLISVIFHVHQVPEVAYLNMQCSKKSYNVTIYIALIETDCFNFVVTSGGVEFYSHPFSPFHLKILKRIVSKHEISIILNHLNIIFNAIVQNCIAILINKKRVQIFPKFFTSLHFLKFGELLQKWRY